MATFAKLKESYTGIFIGVLVAVIIFFVNPSFKDCVDIIRALPQLSTCVFGFLLTLLGIILQGNGPIIERMRKASDIYNRFIDFNKRIVILSFVISVVALIAGYINYDWFRNFFIKICEPSCVLIRRSFIAILSFGVVWLVVDLMTFVKLFYMLIKESK